MQIERYIIKAAVASDAEGHIKLYDDTSKVFAVGPVSFYSGVLLLQHGQSGIHNCPY